MQWSELISKYLRYWYWRCRYFIMCAWLKNFSQEKASPQVKLTFCETQRLSLRSQFSSFSWSRDVSFQYPTSKERLSFLVIQAQVPQTPISLHRRHDAVMVVAGIILSTYIIFWERIAKKDREDAVSAATVLGLVECWRNRIVSLEPEMWLGGSYLSRREFCS